YLGERGWLPRGSRHNGGRSCAVPLCQGEDADAQGIQNASKKQLVGSPPPVRRVSRPAIDAVRCSKNPLATFCEERFRLRVVWNKKLQPSGKVVLSPR